jgi:succinyl-diaminopimelate desuccinylase
MNKILSDQEVIALAYERRDSLVKITCDLVQIDSQTPPSDTLAVAEKVATALADLPFFSVELHQSEAPVVNLVARLDGGLPGRRLILNGHLDTYPMGDHKNWTYPPLSGEIVDGRLYGRGSADMKGGIAALIETVKIYATHLRPFPGEIVLTLAGDEESMGELGTQWLIDNIPAVKGDGVIVADVGSPSSVRLGEKGMIWIDLVATGHQAHGAHVYAGANAIDRLSDALSDLRRLENISIATPPDAARVIDLASRITGSDAQTARDVMTRITVNTGTIAGGVSSNLVPDEARAGIDIRIPLGMSTAELDAQIVDCLTHHPDVNYTVVRRYEPTWTSANADISKACLSAAGQVLPGPVWCDMRIGGSDARLWRRAGFDTVVLGLTPYGLGSEDENLVIDELASLTAIYCIAARRFFDAQ